MTKQSTDMTQPVPTRTASVQAHPTAAKHHAHGMLALTGDEAADGKQLAAAGVAEIARRHERNEDDDDDAA